MFSSIIFWFFTHGRFLTLYSSFWTILILHLLIIWAHTWVSVPSDTLFGFLWVMVAKTTMFRGLLHINAARKVAVVHFNVVVAALSQIFPSSYSSSMFMMLALSSGVSWNVISSDRICIWFALGLFEEIFLLITHFPTFPLEYYFSGL